jgi:hypothetical protein
MHIRGGPAGPPRAVALAMLVLAALASSVFAQSAQETAAILKVMRDTWERPDARLDIAPVRLEWQFEAMAGGHRWCCSPMLPVLVVA